MIISVLKAKKNFGSAFGGTYDRLELLREGIPYQKILHAALRFYFTNTLSHTILKAFKP